jgi:hypothetical protein
MELAHPLSRPPTLQGLRSAGSAVSLCRAESSSGCNVKWRQQRAGVLPHSMRDGCYWPLSQLMPTMILKMKVDYLLVLELMFWK